MPKASRVTYFKARLEDKPGALLAVAKDLKTGNLGLVGIWAYSKEQGQADLYVVPKNPDKLRKAWKDAMLLSEEGTGFLVKGADKTGALVKTLESLATTGINIIALEAVAAGGKYGAFLWVKPEDVEKTATALGAK
ncbi:MAG: hypothetical protein AB1428_15220 [Bacteroidota bacterium]